MLAALPASAAGTVTDAMAQAAPTYEQKLSWILRLEDQRLLHDPLQPAPTAQETAP